MLGKNLNTDFLCKILIQTNYQAKIPKRMWLKCLKLACGCGTRRKISFRIFPHFKKCSLFGVGVYK